MVGIQCKSCGHRALATPPGPFKFDHEIITLLSQSPVKCSECGVSNFAIMRLPSSPDAADSWLKGDGSPPGAKPLIEGGNQ
jgi:hypothetical protein